MTVQRIIIGDIHGCIDELNRLLDAVAPCTDDEIIALGDAVDRGPESRAVVEFFRTTPNARCILGNHERKHVRWHRGELNPAISQRITRTQFAGDTYGEALQYFQSLPLYIDLPEALLVHGFFEPGVPLADQRDVVLVGTMTGEQHVKNNCDRPWYELYDGPKPIIVGHLDYLHNGQPLIWQNRVFGLDTGCCHGGKLTALVLPEFRVVSVESRKDYWAVVRQDYAKKQRQEVGEDSSWAEIEEFLSEYSEDGALASDAPERARRLWEVCRKAGAAATLLYKEVQRVNVCVLEQLRTEHEWDDLPPGDQARLYAEVIGKTPLAPFLHRARRGELTVEQFKSRLGTPARLLKLAEESNLRWDSLADAAPVTAGSAGKEEQAAIRTKSVFEPVEASDGERYLVTRYWPRRKGFTKARLAVAAWIKELAPSRELLADWKAGSISWEGYTARYTEEMASQTAGITRLADETKSHTITLLCFEDESDPHCHRHLLKRIIERAAPGQSSCD